MSAVLKFRLLDRRCGVGQHREYPERRSDPQIIVVFNIQTKVDYLKETIIE
jgi:hypothetical protein